MLLVARKATGRVVSGVRRICRDRGATSVEYALAISVFVLATVGGIDVLEQSTHDEYERSASGIEGLPGNSGFGGGGAPTTVAPTLPTTSTTMVDTPPSSTTLPPSTTVPPTTTTQGPPATTTTTVVHQATISALDDVSTSQGKWTARADIEIVDSVDATPVVGAVLTVNMNAANGSTTIKTCNTGLNGRCVVSWSNLQNKHDPVVATVTNVVASPAWDGVVVAGTLYKP